MAPVNNKKRNNHIIISLAQIATRPFGDMRLLRTRGGEKKKANEAKPQATSPRACGYTAWRAIMRLANGPTEPDNENSKLIAS